MANAVKAFMIFSVFPYSVSTQTSNMLENFLTTDYEITNLVHSSYIVIK